MRGRNLQEFHRGCFTLWKIAENSSEAKWCLGFYFPWLGGQWTKALWAGIRKLAIRATSSSGYLITYIHTPFPKKWFTFNESLLLDAGASLWQPCTALSLVLKALNETGSCITIHMSPLQFSHPSPPHPLQISVKLKAFHFLNGSCSSSDDYWVYTW